MKRNLVLVVLGLLLVGGVVTGIWAAPKDSADEPEASDGMLSVCQDEKALEEQIAQYLETKHKLKLERKRFKADENDMYVVCPFRCKNAPSLRIVIDTQISSKSKTSGKVTERCIRVESAWAIPDSVKKAASFRSKFLEYNNKWLVERWSPGQVHIDKDGDVSMMTFVNIPGADVQVPTEMVYDVVARMVSAWENYYAGLKTALGIREAGDDGDDEE